MLRKLLLFIAPLAVLVPVFWMLFGTRPPVEPAQPLAVAMQPAPAPDPVFVLRDQNLETGTFALMIRNGAEDAAVVLRDQSVILAAQDSAAIIGDGLTPLTPAMLAQTDAMPTLSLYRNDLFIAGYACGAECKVSGIDIGSAISAIPLVVQFNDYDAYLAAILAVTEDPNFGFLDLRPENGLPAPRQVPKLTLDLPVVSIAASALFDIETHRAMVGQAVQDSLPEGASVASVEITDLGLGVIGDIDNSAPILRAGAPIPYPDVRFHGVAVQIDGADTIAPEVLGQIGDLTLTQVDTTAGFTRFTAAQLGGDCAQCYQLTVAGGITDSARIRDAQPETYQLQYYDLREAP
ncbi:MAG: hypothetical protein COB65_00740 [Thalassobium sp.]|nr:MAG: hypothetical protein COB65_00740 [Thalassobium sp.]